MTRSRHRLANRTASGAIRSPRTPECNRTACVAPDGNEIELYAHVPGVNWREQPELLNSASPLEL